jgi:hypothetical protein
MRYSAAASVRVHALIIGDIMTKRLERISRRAVVKIGSAGALLVSVATAGVALLVEACSSDDKKGGYGYGDYGYGYGMLRRGHRAFASLGARSGLGRKVDLG